MVVVEDGLPEEERVPPVQGQGASPGNDDFAAMEEVLTRRFTALPGRARPPGGRSRAEAKFAYPPQLLLVDGGKGQLAWPCGCSRSSGSRTRSRWPRWPSSSRRCSCPGQADPIRIPRQSEALYLLQRIRDEAHRFAITYHRQLRGKRMTKSVLDDIPGLGPDPQKRLIKELGGVNAVKAATLERARRRCRGCPTRWPTRRATTKIHG